MTPDKYPALFKEHWKAIWAFASKRLKDEESAKDVTEQAFIKAWEHMGKFGTPYHFKAFLYICVKNACFNLEQEDRRKPKASLDLADLLPTEEPKYDFDIIEAEVVAFIFDKLETLPPARREVMKLMLSGLSSNQTAARMGVTRKTVLNQKLTAIAELRKMVKLKFDI